MKKGIILLLFFCGVAEGGSLAETYHLSAIMPAGKYRGRKINTTVKRAVSILNGSVVQQQLGVDNHFWLLANIYHNKKFYIAAVPKAAIKQIIFLSEPFSGVFAHSMLRFQFSEPVRLLAEVPTLAEIADGVQAKVLAHPVVLDDLLMSVEATAPHGIEEFSTVESFFNTRGLVFRMMSLTGLGVSRLLSGQATIYQYPLDLTPREAARTLRNVVAKSDQTGMSAMYNTLFANCNKYCAGILEKTRVLAHRRGNLAHRAVAATQSFAANFMIFAQFNPVLMRLRSTQNEPNMERDPAFLRLAAEYPKTPRCEESLTELVAAGG